MSAHAESEHDLQRRRAASSEAELRAHIRKILLRAVRLAGSRA